MRLARGWIAVALVVPLALLAAGCGSSSSGGGGTSSGGSTNESSTGNTASVTYRGLETGLPRSVPKPASAPLKIAILSPLEANEAVHFRTASAQAEVEKLGGSATIYDAKISPETQVTQLEQAIGSGAEAIVMEAVDPHALAPVLKRAEAAKIPVVGIDENLNGVSPGQGFASQVLIGRDLMAYDQAKVAAGLLPAGGKIAVIGFAHPVPQLERMVEKEKEWSERFGLEVLGEAQNPTDEIAGGEKAMTQLISEYPQMEGVIAYNDNSAVGAAAAARTAGKSGLVLIGNNGEEVGLQAVAAGKISATVQVDDLETGKLAAWEAYDLVQGKPVPKAVLAGEPVAVTEENVGTAESWSEQMQKRYGK
ncbi:MAG: sugar ABC transporter substrate-binding protein [Actinobacteria bacterium]|nr:sugar ABC transporter substrate-binding protein [Actinomycetota bacterium]